MHKIWLGNQIAISFESETSFGKIRMIKRELLFTRTIGKYYNNILTNKTNLFYRKRLITDTTLSFDNRSLPRPEKSSGGA